MPNRIRNRCSPVLTCFIFYGDFAGSYVTNPVSALHILKVNVEMTFFARRVVDQWYVNTSFRFAGLKLEFACTNSDCTVVKKQRSCVTAKRCL